MFSHKRHLQDTFDSQHNTKRRLVDHLNGLSIGIDYNNNNNNNNNNNTKSSLFGNFTKEQLNKPLSDPNRVIIKNIDQFLHENPDQLDLIGEKINLDDLRKAGLDNLVISCGLDLKKAWNTIISRYKSNNINSSNNNSNNDDKNLDDLIYKLIWEEYLAKYFSLIKYYNPLKIVWDNYIIWLNKRKIHNMKSSHIIELDNDGDEVMIDNNNNNNNELSPRTQSLRDGTSSYGSYYTHDDHWNDMSSNSDYNYNYNYNSNYNSITNQFDNHQHLNPDSMIEDVDDDNDVEMMED